MSEFKTVLQPAAVRCPPALPWPATHKCEFILNLFYAGAFAAMAPRMLAACAFAALATGCVTSANDLVPDKNMVAVPISGVGHYGSNIGIPRFTVNGQGGGTSNSWGGGGGGICCVLLPRKVTKPMMVSVKWTSCDVSAIAYVNGLRVGPYQRCKEEEHEATVPVNFAVAPGDSTGLYVHFLPGHRIEVWVPEQYPEANNYPGPRYPRGSAPDYAPLPDEKL